MKSDIRVFLCDNDNLRFFGEGPCRLLHLIEETGSLRAAALSMGMAYTKALHLIKRADYETWRNACIQSSRELYTQIFSKYSRNNSGADGAREFPGN